jgi:cell division protein FtsI (penicillin-binding protein 3)
MNEWLERAARARARLGDPLGGERPDESFEVTWRRTVKRRIVIILALLGIWAVLLLGRLLDLQVLQHSELLSKARAQQQDVVQAPADRGPIVDRHGELLAYSVDGAAIEAWTPEIKDAAATAAALCGALGDCTPTEVKSLATRFALKEKWITVRRAREVTQNQIDAVRALELRGISLSAGTRRWYPRLRLAAHLLGYVGLDEQQRDNRGLAGAEHKFDAEIRGREGVLQVQVDARLRRTATHVRQAPTAGATIELTIDSALQYIVERELLDAVQTHRARGGMAVVLDPMTGEVLAMASVPTFNPNAPFQTPIDYSRNRAVQDMYEPGSTFKIVTASAALEEGVLKPTDLVDCSAGILRIPGRAKPIRDDHRIGVVPFEDVIVYSSNIGAIQAGARVGAERLGRYMTRFGFGERLSPDFGGEARGVVFNPARLDQSALASVSMGYQVSVTALQMAAATSAIANGGLLLQPRLKRATIRDGVRTAVEPAVIRRAISQETAATMTGILEEVVSRGTAKAARLERYQVAGKTGTAKKVVNGAYSSVEFNASFVGFVPSRRPAVTIVVVIDTPRGGQYYGGLVAAPVFKRIAEAALRQLGIPPTINPVPPVIAATAKPEPMTGQVRTIGTDGITPALTVLGGTPQMPDVRGMSGREAIRVLNQAGLRPQMQGDGFVVDQSPSAGADITPGARAIVKLSRGQDKAGPRR